MKLADWMDFYITKHRVNGELTPLEAWKVDATPLEEVVQERLWVDMLIAKERCKVSKNGIRFDRIDFTAPEITGVVGRKVEVRYLPHDRTFIEVFLDGDHLCTALPQLTLDADEEKAVTDARRVARLKARRRFTTANRQRKKNAKGPVHKLTIDKDGNRNVVEAADDLLEGGDVALAELVGEPQGQGKLF